jgi:predicted ATPase
MVGRGIFLGQARSFVGRREELAHLTSLLGHGLRLITVVAPGGYGKSRLVRQLCTELSGKYSHGVVEVPLAPLGDPVRIASTTASALGLKLTGGADPQQQLCDYLREKQLLLYFDNFEHVLSGAALVAELLGAAPQLQVITTSREPLNLPGESVFPLEALPVESPADAALNHHYSAAVQLFADRAQAASTDFAMTPDTAPAVAEICHALDGVPLAIELAAAWSGHYALPELKRELRQQLDLTALDSEVPERHRSVRASCDWSYRLLNDEQQLVLRCLAAFKGGFFLSAGQYVIPATDLAGDLKALAGKSWLYIREALGQPRYFLHDAAIREYAYQKLLSAEDFEVAVLMHCRYYAALLEREAQRVRSAEQLTALQLLAVEEENLYQALETALKRDDPALLLPFARHLHEFQLMMGEARFCRSMSADIAARAQELRCPEAQQEAQCGLAGALLHLDCYEEARQATKIAKDLALQRQDALGLARANLILGDIERLEGHHTAARFNYEEALGLARQTGDTYYVASALHHLGRVEMTESSFETSLALIGESLALRREHGDIHGVAACQSDLGNIAYRAGRYDEARQLNAESLDLRRRLGDRRGIAQSLNCLGNVEFAEGDYPAAWQLYSDSLELKRDIGERFGIATSLNNLGNVEYCEGNFLDSRRLHEEGLAIKRDILDRMGIAYSLGNLGNISVRLQEYARAAGELLEGLGLAYELHSKECTLATLAIAASLFARLESWRVTGILYFGVCKQLPLSGLALDPMDGGMLETAGHLLEQELKPALRAELSQAAEQLDLPALVHLAQAELAGAAHSDNAATAQ